MTEAYEDDWLVRVRAQVMCRDEGTGGWLPLGGGGLSNVMVRKRTRHSSSGQTDTLTLTSSGAVPTSAVNSPPNSTPLTQTLRGASGAPPRLPNSNGRPQNGSPRRPGRHSGNPLTAGLPPHNVSQHAYHRHTPSDGSADARRTPGVIGSLSRSANPLGNAPKTHQHFKQFGGSGGQLETLGLRTCGLEDANNGSQQVPTSVGSGNSGTNSGAGALGLKFEYFIYGKRINDQSVVLSCTIKKDFQYNKVMPTFHHWVTDEKRFGLTFQTAADARAFDKGVRTAIEDLLDGLGGAWPSLHEYKKLNPAPKEDEDDNIFECLNLPSDSRSSSENSTASRSHRRHGNEGPPLPALFRLDVKQPPVYNAAETMGLSASARELLLKKKLSGSCSEEPPMFVGDSVDNSYVQITQVHDYVYPRLGSGLVSLSGDRSPSSQSTATATAPGSNTTTHSLLQRRDSGSSLKKRAPVSLYSDPPSLLGFRPGHRPALQGNKRDRDLNKKPLPVSEGYHARIKCRHCQDWYMESSNKPGSCEYAPDCFKTCINKSSGIQCAQCMLYHCMSDAEGDFATHPCSCNTAEEGCSRRWIGLTLLSLFVPCLWCYPPLKAVHWCCVGCGISGGKHMPVQHSYSHH